LLGETAHYAIILNTHVALPSEDSSGHLSEMTENEGVPGRWYREYDPNTTDRASLDQLSWASWGNYRSFWPTAPALFKALEDAGFDLLFEQADWLSPDIPGSMKAWLYASFGRRALVGIRTKQARRGLFGTLRAWRRAPVLPAAGTAPGLSCESPSRSDEVSFLLRKVGE
jgi:hypothetical protein